MEDNGNAITALERVLLTVEAELTALHTGQAVDHTDLARRLQTDLSTSMETEEPVEPVEPVAPTTPATPFAPPPPPPPVAPVAASVPPPPQAPPVAMPAPPRQPPIAPPHPSGPSRKGIDLERVFRIGGISLVVLAALFFVSTAISRGWIGPTAQLALAALTSLAMIGQSFRFSEDSRPWRLTMAVGGATSLFVSGVVGHFGLELLDINLTLLWLGATILGFLALGRAHDSEAVAACGAIAAALGAALFWLAGDAATFVLLGLAIVWSLSVLVATWDQRWFAARGLGAAAGAAIVLMAAIVGTGTGAIEVLAVTLGIAAVVSIAGSQIREIGIAATEGVLSPLAQIEARLAAAITPWATFTAVIAIRQNFAGLDDHIGWLGVVIGLTVLAGMTEMAARVHPTMTMLHQLAGVATATAGFVAVIDGPVLIAALLGQAVITGIFAFRTRAPEMTIGAMLLASVPALWTLSKITQGITGIGLTVGEIVVSGLVVAVVAAVTYVLRDRSELEKAWMASWALYLVWIAAAMQGIPQTQMAISLAWAASAIVLIITRSHLWEGASRERLRSVLNVGLGTLLVTGGKLIFIDLVAVDVLWRAGLFLLIGATFLRLAFVLPKMIDDDPRPQQPHSVDRESQPV